MSLNANANIFGRALLTAALVLIVGCGSSAPAHPDTGAGAGQTPPLPKACSDFCQRMTNCGVTLCNEDTHSTQFTALGPILLTQCNLGCNDQVLAQITDQQWTCLFSSSCRQAIDAEYDQCNIDSHYQCN